MFYSQCLVSKKGALGAIWVAAYFFKKLKKAQVKETDIPSSVDEILQNELDAVAYRVLAYLLLGVVRIYSKKVDYLFNDCNKVLIGIKDFVIKEKNRAQKAAVPAPCFTIALPERFELDAFDLEILDDFHGGNVKPQEDITLKERGWQNERMGQHSMEKFDFEDNALNAFHETYSADHDKIEGESSARDMGVEVENVKSVQEENAIRESFCMVEEEPLRLIESSGNHLNAHKHAADLDSDKMLEEVSWENIQHDGFHPDKCISPDKIYGFERQPSDDLQTNGEEINILGKVESIGEMHHVMENPSNLPESVEKLRDRSDEERTDFGVFHGTVKEPFEVAKPNHEGPNTDSEMGGLRDMTFSGDGNSRVDAKDTPVLVTPEAPLQLKIPEASGVTTPQFTVIATPANKEGARISRKRKCLIDSTVVIPNKFMKQWIEDSSELITKRRKVPHTPLFAWRTKRFSNLSRCFFDPLIPYGSLELRLLFLQGKLTSLESAGPVEPRKREMTETPTAAETSGRQKNVSPESIGTPVTAANSNLTEKETMETPQADVVLAEPTVNALEMMENPQAAETAEQAEIAPETPVRESKSIRFFKSLESPNDKEVIPPNSFGSFDEEPEIFNTDKDLDMILMLEELVSANERGDSQLDGWSGRTRAVARYLEKAFLNQRKRGDEEIVSLLQLCRGRTQKEGARLFYETLVLKTKGYVDVKQDDPFGDVLVMQVSG